MNAAEAGGPAPVTGRVAGRLQTVLVLVITAVVLGAAALLLGGGGFGQSDGVTPVTLTGAIAGTAPTVGAARPSTWPTTRASRCG